MMFEASAFPFLWLNLTHCTSDSLRLLTCTMMSVGMMRGVMNSAVIICIRYCFKKHITVNINTYIYKYIEIS